MRKRILTAIFSIFFIWIVLAASYKIYNMALANKSRIKTVITRKIGRFLNADAEIRDIKFGLIDNITLLDLKLEMDSDTQIISADAERVIIRYNIWNLLSKFLSLNKQEDYPNGFSFPRSLIVEEGKFRWRQRSTGLEIRRSRIYAFARLYNPEDIRVRISSKETEMAGEYLSGKINLTNGSFDLSLNFSQTAGGPDGYSLIANGQIAKEADQDPRMDLFVKAKNKYLQSEFNARGSSGRIFLEGRFNLLNHIILPFSAEVAIDEGVIASFDDGSRDPKVRLIAKFLKSDFNLVIKLEHMNFKNVDIVSELDLSGRIKAEDGSGLVVEGKIISRNSILGYKPFKELDGSYQIKDGLLEILSLKVGGNLALSGYVSLKPPYLADLSLTVKLDSLDEINPPLSIFEGLLTAQGVEGEFKLVGPINNPELKGRLETGSGFLEGLGDYQRMSVNLKGKGKILRFSDSKIHREEGSFTINGEINLAKENIFEDLKIGIAEQGMMVWKDWKLIGDRKKTEVRLSKDIGDEFRINFKTYLDDKTGRSNDDNSQIELEYELGKSESIKMQMKEDESFLAIEHSFRF